MTQAENEKNKDLQKLDSGVRAFVYQQISQLESLLPVGSEIGMQLFEGKEKKVCEARLSVTVEGERLAMASEGKDEFDAIKNVVENAKTELAQEFPLEGESVLEARESLVNAIIDKNYLH